jgi:hypothetical protein
MPRHEGEVAALLAGPFPRLRELVVDARCHPMKPRDLASLLVNDAAPRLETLTLWWVTPEACLPLLDALGPRGLGQLLDAPQRRREPSLLLGTPTVRSLPAQPLLSDAAEIDALSSLDSSRAMRSRS